jgi:hypothetical protein
MMKKRNNKRLKIVKIVFSVIMVLSSGGCIFNNEDNLSLIDPEDAERVSGYIDVLPWGQEALDDAGKREKFIEAVIRACAEFAPGDEEWQIWCQAFLVAAACRESSLQIDLVHWDIQDPPVGLLQIRFGSVVRVFDTYGNKEALERIGCAWPDFSGLGDEDWANPGLEHIQWLQDVQCNVGLGAWYYFLMASGNGAPPYYVHNYCAGDGTPGNLVIGMLDYFGGPGTSAGFDENDPYSHYYVAPVKEYFDNMIIPTPEPHPFIRPFETDICQHCENCE